MYFLQVVGEHKFQDKYDSISHPPSNSDRVAYKSYSDAHWTCWFLTSTSRNTFAAFQETQVAIFNACTSVQSLSRHYILYAPVPLYTICDSINMI